MGPPRNSTLDVLKLFAACMVVCIHVTFPGNLGMAVEALARFAVPLFFLVSGYFAWDASPEILRKRMGRLLLLLVSTALIYTAYNTLGPLWKGDVSALAQHFRRYLDGAVLLNLFFLNFPVHQEHLWYLLSMLYVYTIYYLLRKFRVSERRLDILCACLLVLHLVLGEVLPFFGIAVPIPLVRNFLLMGLPFFGLGLFVRRQPEMLRRMPSAAVALLIGTGTLEALGSRFLFGHRELYIGSVLILLGLTALFLKYPGRKYPPFLSVLADCGTYIYLFHPLTASVIKKGYALVGLSWDASPALQMLHPLLVCLITTMGAWLLVKCRKKIRKMFAKIRRK